MFIETVNQTQCRVSPYMNLRGCAVKMRASVKVFFHLFMALALTVCGVNLSVAQQSESTQNASEASQGQFLGAKPTEYPSWFKESFLEFSDDIAEAAEQGKRVMLVFHQDGCPYCNLLVERNLSQKNIVDLMQAKLDVIAINMWGDREVVTVEGEPFTEKQLAAALRVQFTPTLLFFNESGKPILTLNGYLPPDEFLTALRYVTQGQETQVTYREFVRDNLPESDGLGDLMAQPFFQAPPYDFRRQGNGSGKPLAVFFEQKQCPNCQTLHTKVLVDHQTRDLIAKYDVAQLDMWSNTPIVTPEGLQTTAKDWASALQVSFAPTIVLFDQSGQEAIRSEAWFKIFHTQSLFDYVLTESHRSQPSFQRYISDRADHLIEQGVDVNIWE